MCLFVGQIHMALMSVLLGGLLVSGVGVPWLSGVISRTPAKELVTRRAGLSQALVDGLQGMPDLLAYNGEEAVFEQFNAVNRAEARAQRQMVWSGALVSGINLLVVNCTLVGVLLIAIPLVSTGLIDGVMLAVLALVTLSSFEATSSLGAAAQHLQSSMNAAQRLFEISDQVPEVNEPAQPLAIPDAATLSFRKVSLTYPGELKPAIQSVSFELPAGKRIGILGPSGGGKSSLLNLVLRFWDFDAGQILLDGQDIRRYASNDVRQKLAVISQDTYLFTTTVRENLRLANPQAGEADMLRALEIARLTPWLQNLPRGLDTWIGEHGLLMSGGERQRLAAVRAILRDASLFLLDEPTNYLDAETEAGLVSTLLDITRYKSVLWVSHSLQGMDEMDEILVMQEGRIVERGIPSELLAGWGLNARLAGTNTRKPSS
jgi:ATP-binding cassette subfamily C protein CydC